MSSRNDSKQIGNRLKSEPESSSASVYESDAENSPSTRPAEMSPEKPEKEDVELARRLNNELPRYKEPKLHHRRFRHNDLQPLLQFWQQCPGVTSHVEGYSAEGRSITRISMGNGAVSVLLWSQMHGDEPTATMALCDVMRFLTASDSFDEVRRRWLGRLTLHIVPMLNPDAAERYQRHTPEGIDLNRDARSRQCPESVLLKRLRDQLEADFAFNLHDQNSFYAVGDTGVPAALALMAPPADIQCSVSPVRRRSMQLIVRLRAMLEAGLPGKISAWDDGFEPRAFGDNMQRWGSSTVLIESGTLAHDPEKQQVRHWTALALLQAFEELSSGSWQTADESGYHSIPPNRSTLYSGLFKGVRITGSGGQAFRVDVGFRRHEVPDRGNGFFVRSEIDQIGDLGGFFGYEQIDAPEWTLRPLTIITEEQWLRAGLPAADVQGRDVHSTWNKNVTGSGEEKPAEGALAALRTLLEQGVGAVRLAHPPEETYTSFPVNLAGPACREMPPVVPGAPANFCFVSRGRVVCSVVNGFIWRFDRPGAFVVPEGASGMVFR